MTDATEIHFDGWVLRPSSGELLRDGNTQRLAQQPLRMLIELLAHPGEVVTRERLMQVLWPKGVVDFSYGNVLYPTRRYQEAIDYVRPLLASQPRFDQARGVLIRAPVGTGDVKSALEQLPLRFAEVPTLSDAGAGLRTRRATR